MFLLCDGIAWTCKYWGGSEGACLQTNAQSHALVWIFWIRVLNLSKAFRTHALRTVLTSFWFAIPFAYGKFNAYHSSIHCNNLIITALAILHGIALLLNRLQGKQGQNLTGHGGKSLSPNLENFPFCKAKVAVQCILAGLFTRPRIIKLNCLQH